MSEDNFWIQRQVMSFGLEADDADDLGVGIPLAQLFGRNAVFGEVSGLGCRTVPFHVAAQVVDLGLRPFLHLAVMGHILAATVLQMMNYSLQFHIVFVFDCQRRLSPRNSTTRHRCVNLSNVRSP